MKPPLYDGLRAYPNADCSNRRELASIPFSVNRESLVYASGEVAYNVNGTDGNQAIVQMQLRNGSDTVTLASGGFTESRSVGDHDTGSLSCTASPEGTRATFRAARDRGPLAPTESPPDNEPPAGLTGRQSEIAVLVARGLTNRQIASELSLSEHTVANHVARTMRKLGLSSGSQLAAWATEQQPPSSY